MHECTGAAASSQPFLQFQVLGHCVPRLKMNQNRIRYTAPQTWTELQGASSAHVWFHLTISVFHHDCNLICLITLVFQSVLHLIVLCGFVLLVYLTSFVLVVVSFNCFVCSLHFEEGFILNVSSMVKQIIIKQMLLSSGLSNYCSEVLEVPPPRLSYLSFMQHF